MRGALTFSEESAGTGAFEVPLHKYIQHGEYTGGVRDLRALAGLQFHWHI